MRLIEPTWITLEELCERLKKDPATIQKWVKRGCPREKRPKDGGGYRSYFDPEAVADWLARRARKGPGRPPLEEQGIATTDGPAGDALEQIRRKKLEKLSLECKKLALEVGVKGGALLKADEVRSEISAVFSRIRVGLEAIPGRIAGDVMAAKSRGEAEGLIRGEIGRVLRELVER